MSEQLRVGERVVRVTGVPGEGTIRQIIPGHMGKYPVHWVEAKAAVEWPDPHRIGGRGYKITTVALSALAHPKEMGPCAKCGKHKRLTTTGTTDFPVRLCGTCQHREERRINTREMYGHGRQGY